jgi:hypothetical protein
VGLSNPNRLALGNHERRQDNGLEDRISERGGDRRGAEETGRRDHKRDTDLSSSCARGRRSPHSYMRTTHGQPTTRCSANYV